MPTEGCECAHCRLERERDVGPVVETAGSDVAALRRLLTAASLMRLQIKERAAFLTRTTDWERLQDAMRNAELVLRPTGPCLVLNMKTGEFYIKSPNTNVNDGSRP